MNKVKYTRVSNKYTNRKINNFDNISKNLKEYSYIIALNINQIPCHILNDLRNKLYIHGHKPFKIINKIALKVFKIESLFSMIKGQILYVGSKDLQSVMKICNMFNNITPVVGIYQNTLIAKDILSISGKYNRSQLIALCFYTLEQKMLDSIINIFEIVNA